MDASVAGMRLASSVVTPLLKKFFRAEGAGAGLVDRPVRVSSYVSLREKRTLVPADVLKIAERIVAEALRSPGERPLPPGEEAGVAAALVATLDALGEVALTDLEAVRLGPEAFAAALRARAPYLGLGADAALFHERLLVVLCVHVLDFFTRRSTFVAATLVDQSRTLGELIDKTDQVLDRVPHQLIRDTAFETRYLAQVARKHGTLTIYGIDLAPGTAKWPLSTAYLRLEVDGGGAVDTAPRPHLFWTDRIPGRLLDTGPGKRGRRVLLRGEAGSGKTTLIQWLTVTAATGPADSPLHGLVPYVLPLRTLTRHGRALPAPRDFLAAVGSPLAGEQPDGWEGRVLDAGRALVLVDGIDEIPEAERAGARAWLTDLIDAYPGNRWLVTSRPSAVREDWLAEAEFSELSLAPMSPHSVAEFVRRWHTAAASGDPEHAEADAALEGYREQLLESLRTTRDLARLATNPLLCGLICALHRERRGFLPSGRKELYTAALSMLLHRRDRERRLRVPELGEEPQLQLLQRLAHWLIRNGRTELDRERAEALLADALPAVPEVARILGNAAAVLQHFLDRTGLLRAPSATTVEFVHRTFQDFLGARAALDEGGLGELAGHAEDDQWEDVIRMAVAQARPRERAEIIRTLLDRGRSQRPVLLAFAALEHAAELDPELRGRVIAAAAELVPPRDTAAARALGQVGPLVLDLLPGPEAVEIEDTALFTVVAAGATGSDLAIPFLARYASQPSRNIRRELAVLWHAFDPGAYAREVLARIDPATVHITVRNERELEALSSIEPGPTLHVAGDLSGRAIGSYLRRHPVDSLIIHDSLVSDLEFLRGYRSLRSLYLANCVNLADLSALSGLPLQSVTLDLDAELPVGEVTESWTELTSLELRGVQGDWSLDRIAPEAVLLSLELRQMRSLESGTNSRLGGLRRHQELRKLSLGPRWIGGPAAWEEIAALANLNELVVPASSLALAPAGLSLPSVHTLWMASGLGLKRTTQAEALVARLFPGLRDVPPDLWS
ncbi:NACHT domain-containing protein [Streptomyces sp. NPDC098789]|uniref:NACHT domain-containing protein n=1 Tax=Streptomyces sp. NPDC098789 TaxID=3366098 RepID=UPI00381AD5A3